MLIKRKITVKVDTGEWDDEADEPIYKMEEKEQYSVGIHYRNLARDNSPNEIGRAGREYRNRSVDGDAQYFMLKDDEWVEFGGLRTQLETMAYGTQTDYHHAGRSQVRSKGSVTAQHLSMFKWMRGEYWKTLDEIQNVLLDRNYNNTSHKAGLGTLRRLQEYEAAGMRLLTNNKKRDQFDAYGVQYLNPNTYSDSQMNKRRNAFIPNYALFELIGEQVKEEWVDKQNMAENLEMEKSNLLRVVSSINSLKYETESHESATTVILGYRNQFADLKTTMIKSLLLNRVMSTQFKELLCEETDDYRGDYISEIGSLEEGEKKYKQTAKTLAAPSFQDLARGVGCIDSKRQEWNCYTENNEPITAEEIERAVTFVETVNESDLLKLRQVAWEDRQDAKKARQGVLAQIEADHKVHEDAWHTAINAKSTRTLTCDTVKAEYKAAVLALIGALSALS